MASMVTFSRQRKGARVSWLSRRWAVALCSCVAGRSQDPRVAHDLCSVNGSSETEKARPVSPPSLPPLPPTPFVPLLAAALPA